tara:strand:- start:2109 stop:2807 length:699 start_codon:yes stop_codon:yes gene_type:complete
MSRQGKLAALASTGVTKTELDNIDGGTSRGTTAIADGDGVLINDAGTMRMTSVETMATYMGTKIGGGMEFLASSGAISNAANVSFTQFDASKYDHYQFWVQNVVPATDNTSLQALASTDGGSSYDSTNGNYHQTLTTDRTGFDVSLGNGYNMGSDTNEFGVCTIFILFNPHLTTYTYATSNGVMMDTSGQIREVTDAGVVHLVAADVDAIKFQMLSGNIESGEITMFGIVNS